MSSTNSPPPEIATNTLALLAQFQDQRAKQEAKFARLEAKAKARAQARARQEEEDAKKEAEENEDEEGALAEAEAWADIERLARIDAGVETPPIAELPVPVAASENGDNDLSSDVLSVDEWRQVVMEDYQQSQFWYSTPFAYTLARNIYARLEHLSGSSSSAPTIAFLCSPTAFVAFQHLYHQTGTYRSGINVFLMEIDSRFKVAAGDGFIRYDFNFPTKGLSHLQNKVDMVVIDPPYLNQPTTNLIAQTVDFLTVKPSQQRERGGDILLLTGDSIGDYASKTYPRAGQSPLVRTRLQVEHDGGRLSNEFSAWGSWRGAEEFGSVE